MPPLAAGLWPGADTGILEECGKLFLLVGTLTLPAPFTPDDFAAGTELVALGVAATDGTFGTGCVFVDGTALVFGGVGGTATAAPLADAGFAFGAAAAVAGDVAAFGVAAAAVATFLAAVAFLAAALATLASALDSFLFAAAIAAWAFAALTPVPAAFAAFTCFLACREAAFQNFLSLLVTVAA